LAVVFLFGLLAAILRFIEAAILPPQASWSLAHQYPISSWVAGTVIIGSALWPHALRLVISKSGLPDKLSALFLARG